MENNPSKKEEVSAATAVLLGVLAPGGQTWNTLKIAFLMLGLCLTAMLALAFSASDSALIIHICHVTCFCYWDPILSFNKFLGLCCNCFLSLFSKDAKALFIHRKTIGINSFLAQTGLVTVENQMKEMGLAPKIDLDKSQ